MPKLRLFGPVADAAGTRTDVIDGSSIDKVLADARVRYGARFAEELRTCRVWVNGEDPLPGALLGETDEVALLPPVSGG
ncbi:MAG: MoaD/ThiS family protein [Acidimicrobiales bacterium]